MKTIPIFLILSCGVFAQSAKVVALNGTDTARVKAAYEAKQKAEADWQAAQTEIEHKYVSDSREEPDYGTSGSLTLSGDVSTGTALSYFTVDGRFHDISTTETNPCEARYANERIDLADTQLCIAYKRVVAEREAKLKAEREESDRKEQERLKALPKKTVYSPKAGWERGFEFSDGFQFIVPKPAPEPTKQIQWNGGNVLGGCTGSSCWTGNLRLD